MIAFDTNLLVYAHRKENPWHNKSYTLLVKIAESQKSWAIPWPCIHEFISVVTNPRIFKNPSDIKTALQFIEDLCKSPTLYLLSEEVGYEKILFDLSIKGNVRGAMIHDARIIALCIYHGVDKLYSADRDFGRFHGIEVSNPLLG